MPSQRLTFAPTLDDEPSSLWLFEVEHGDTVIRIADDWDGHILIEKLYVALREARRARDEATLLTKAGPIRGE